MWYLESILSKFTQPQDHLQQFLIDLNPSGSHTDFFRCKLSKFLPLIFIVIVLNRLSSCVHLIPPE